MSKSVPCVVGGTPGPQEGGRCLVPEGILKALSLRAAAHRGCWRLESSGGSSQMRIRLQEGLDQGLVTSPGPQGVSGRGGGWEDQSECVGWLRPSTESLQ